MVEDAGNAFEIDKFHYIQIDFRALRQATTSSNLYTAYLKISSVEHYNNEGFLIYGSNVMGVMGKLVYDGTLGDQNCVQSLEIPNYQNITGKGYNFYSVQASGSNPIANVLLESLSSSPG